MNAGIGGTTRRKPYHGKTSLRRRRGKAGDDDQVMDQCLAILGSWREQYRGAAVLSLTCSKGVFMYLAIASIRSLNDSLRADFSYAADFLKVFIFQSPLSLQSKKRNVCGD